MPKIVLTFALLASCAALLLATREASAQPPARSSSPTITDGLVMAQSWGRPSQESESPIGRIRARSIIKLGLFIAAMIGGLIAFLVRMTSPKRQRTEGGGARPEEAQWGTAAPAVAGAPPPTAPAKPLQPMQPTQSRSSAGGLIVVLLIVGLGGFAMMAGVAFLGAVWYFRSVAMTPPAPQPFIQGDKLLQDLNAAHEAQLAAQAEFESRWQGEPLADLEARANLSLHPHQAAPVGKPPFPEFQPPAPLETLTWTEQDAVDSGLNITNQGMSFAEFAPAGGVLVGLRVTNSRGRLSSIQAIYQTEDQYRLGAIHGEETLDYAQFLAPEGEAVSALRIDLGGRVEGVQLEFAKLIDGRLDESETRPGSHFGRKIPNSVYVIEGEGDVFVGLAGKIRDGFDGLSLKRNMMLGKPEDARQLTNNNMRMLPRAGGEGPSKFQSRAPQGGFLVGMRVFTGRSWGGAIRGVQPIYQVGDRYELGNRYGSDGGLATQAIARPGYAIGEIDVHAGLALNSIRVGFQRITEEGLDPADNYQSPRYGCDGGGPFLLNSQGDFIVGVHGTFHEDIVSLQAEIAN